MAITREQKADQLQELIHNLDKAQSVIFAHYIGMTVSDVSDFRKQLRSQNAEMKVAKKTLMRLAAKEKNLPELPEDQLTGPVACIFSFGDPLTGAQIALKFSKEHPQVAFLGGIFEGKLLSKEEAKSLATIPSREVLLATFAGMVRSPLVSFASMCNAPLGGLARAISEMSKKGGFSATSSSSTTVETAAPVQTDATGDPIDPETGGRTEVVLGEDLNSPSSGVTETPAEAAPEGASTEEPTA
jgi:large subunit ribosomal protein L10